MTEIDRRFNNGSSSLYARIGGNSVVLRALQKLYVRILTDPELSPFFPADNIDRLKHSQLAFVMTAFGDAHEHTRKTLREGHAHLVTQGFTDKHFDALLYHLKKVLQEMAVFPDVMSEVLEIAESARGDVLGR